MQFEAHIFIIQFSIFYYKSNLATPLVGPNVRSAQPNEFPFIVSIMKTRNFDPLNLEQFHKCTGTLVSKKDVLTAEHCLRDTLTEGFKVMAGSHDLTQTTPFFPMTVWTYEHWARFKNIKTPSENTDMAFIKLLNSVPNTIQFAPTGNIENRYLWGLDHVIAGFGKQANHSVSRILLAVGVKVLSSTECEKKIYELLEIRSYLDETQLCTVGNPYALLFGGDSGGPLLYFGTLIGINIGIFPNNGGNITSRQVNLHMGIRFYQRFITDCIHNFKI